MLGFRFFGVEFVSYVFNSATMKHFALILLAALTWSVHAQTTCVDPLACNFTELGECEFLDDNGMPCVTEGCAITGACNFDPEADINDGSCEFTSCLGCTDEAACNYDPEAVYLDLSCIYFVDCNGVCGGDWIEDECGNCYETSIEFDVLTFTPCGANGRVGPTQEQCDSEYGENVVTVQEGIQTWVVPATGTYWIEAFGAQGGGSNSGKGAMMSGFFDLIEGAEIDILVGQQGSTIGDCSSGGGGSYVSKDGVPLIVAGGGGGAGWVLSGGGLTSKCGGSGTQGCCGGCDGDGGSGNQGGNGAGFYGNGDPSGYYSVVAQSFLNGGHGGYYSQYPSLSGGFGGGGAAHTNCEPGAGGGYSGGSADWGADQRSAGGGGSYNEGENQENSGDVNAGHGLIRISSPVFIIPDCVLGCAVSQACNFDPEATNDDGSCDFCFCGPGTEYDIELGQCMIVNGSPDINGDGCTNLNDLLDLLSGYGTCED